MINCYIAILDLFEQLKKLDQDSAIVNIDIEYLVKAIKDAESKLTTSEIKYLRDQVKELI